MPLAQWLRGRPLPTTDLVKLFERPLPTDLVKLFRLAEVFAHAIGVGFIVLTIAVLDPAARRTVPRILAASLGAGLLANSFKLVVARWPPQDFDFKGNVGDTFIEWLPLLTDTAPDGRSLFARGGGGGAGGGVGVAVSAAVGGRCWRSCPVATLVEGSHFLSDVFSARNRHPGGDRVRKHGPAGRMFQRLEAQTEIFQRREREYASPAGVNRPIWRRSAATIANRMTDGNRQLKWAQPGDTVPRI